MSDVTCPYCKEEQEINHDDGYGYEEDKDFEQNCVYCGHDFKFSTSISFSYEVYCQGVDHKLSNTPSHCPEVWDCDNCDYCEVIRDKS